MAAVIHLSCLSPKRISDDEGSEGEEHVVTLGELEALRSGQDLNTLSGSSSVVSPPPGKWVCAQSSESKKVNHNQCLTEKLGLLEKAYSVQGDKWRALGYSKTINVLKSYHKPITSYQVNLKGLNSFPFILPSFIKYLGSASLWSSWPSPLPHITIS